MHRAELAVQDRTRVAQFPASVAEYRALRERDARVRVARFLALPADDKQARERTMAEFGWVYRQVRPLEEEYTRDVSAPFCSRFRLTPCPLLRRAMLNSFALASGARANEAC